MARLLRSRNWPEPLCFMAFPPAIIYDFDGTLVTGTNTGYVRCYHAATLSQGHEIPFEVAKERVLEKWGAAPRVELQSVLRDAPHLVDGALVEYEKLLNSELFYSTVASVAGAKEALAQIRQMDIEQVVISGMPQVLLEKFSNEYSFQFKNNELVSTIDTDDPLKQKSTGYHLKQVIKAKGWRSEQLLVVGDAQSDIVMADTQNIRTVIVLTGLLNEETAFKLGAYKVLPSIAELPAALQLET